MNEKPHVPGSHRPNLWERLTLTLDKNGNKSEFIARVGDIKPDSYILENTTRRTGDLRLAKGDTVEVSYNRADAAYSFKASILDLFEGNTSTVAISKTNDTNRTQRRQYVRLDISGKIAFRVLNGGIGDDGGLKPAVSGSLLNISAGGVLFESPISINQKDIIVLSFTLKGHQTLDNILGVIKRCEGSPEEGYLIGAEFITNYNLRNYNLEKISQFLPPGVGTFDDNLQKLIIQFIYNQQVELRKKELLGR